MIKYELDKNNFMTGNWCAVGNFDNQVETEETEIDLNKYWNGNNWETGENPKLKQSQLEEEIKDLKQKLYDTDYQAIKFAEGLLTADEYAETKAQRQEWRDRINELEKKL